MIYLSCVSKRPLNRHPQVATAQDKLRRRHPAAVMTRELAARHAGKPYWADLVWAVQGGGGGGEGAGGGGGGGLRHALLQVRTSFGCSVLRTAIAHVHAACGRALPVTACVKQ